VYFAQFKLSQILAAVLAVKILNFVCVVKDEIGLIGPNLLFKVKPMLAYLLFIC